MKKLSFQILSLLLIFCASCVSTKAESNNPNNPKREFRGAWLHVIGQTQWAEKSPEQQRKYIIDQFDKLGEAGCNAVIFQVRPCADAL